MKVAFATDDKVTISRMTGRAKIFAIYTVEDGEVTDIEYIENNHEHDHDHGHENEHEHEHEHSHSHGEHNHTHKEGDGKGNGAGHNSHSGHSHKKIIYELATRNALFVTRHLGKHFKEGIVELGVKFKMTKTALIADALKEL